MHSSLERLHAGYAELLTGRSAEALEIHPSSDPARWNGRQIVEHLLLTYQSSSAVFSQRLAKGRPTQSQPKPYQRIQQFFVCRFSYFPTGRKAPPGVVPAASVSELLDGDALAAALQSHLQLMDEILVVCEERFGDKRFAAHQVLGPLSARQWRSFHAAHGRCHLKQLGSLGLSPLAKEAQIPGEN
jgi:hypothetical protein